MKRHVRFLLLPALVGALFISQPLPAQQGVARQGERWEDIGARTARTGFIRLPIRGEAGPSVFKTQILLDRALFSPGIVDGRWGKNTAKAVYWLQRREGLPATGRVDRATLARLEQLAGAREPFVRSHRLSTEDVQGPFVDIPENIYERAEMECMCYESLAEKLGETFHTSPAVLRELNPGVNLNGLRAGDVLLVPNVRDSLAGMGANVARLVISDGGHYVHAVDPGGRIVYHFPSTLGADYAPSPRGDFKVNSITKRPTWYYQPDILERVDNSRPPAVIPPGANNAVGLVWMDLSKPHYGIHGTSAPETIGYAESHGCVRLTNWDALFLADRVEAGIPVDFIDGGAWVAAS